MTSLLHVTTEFEEFYQQRHSIYAQEYRLKDIAPNASLEGSRLRACASAGSKPASADATASIWRGRSSATCIEQLHFAGTKTDTNRLENSYAGLE